MRVMTYNGLGGRRLSKLGLRPQIDVGDYELVLVHLTNNVDIL